MFLHEHARYPYYPPIQKARELLDAGTIGEPSLIRIHTTRAQDIATPVIDLDPEAYVWRRDPTRNPGGVLYDDGVHKYAVAMLWGGDIEHIQAMVSETSDFILETPSVAMWKFKQGNCLGIIDYTNASQLTIRGKYVRVDEFFESRTCTRLRKSCRWRWRFTRRRGCSAR
jgi:predicted dehydrogenase